MTVPDHGHPDHLTSGAGAAGPAVSVLDLVPVHTGQTTSQALAASVELARVADAAGYTRFWVAEHHNSPGVASTSPPVIIGLLAAATQRMRIGSGGVMLPNHAPLAVAEQFAVLEAAFPGRIDLGIGRAPGTDPVTSWALRSGGAGPEGDPVEQFPEYVQQVMAFASPEGASVRLRDGDFTITATPRATSEPMVWLLGSSDYSARLAAELGLPYVFAHHFAGQGTAEALALYRSTFAGEGQPRTFLTVNAVIADDAAEAARLALPYQHMMAAIRTGSARQPLPTVEEAEARVPALSADLFDRLAEPWLLGSADEVAGRVRALAAEYGVDEVMVHPIAGALAGDPADRMPARERTVRELAEQLNVAA